MILSSQIRPITHQLIFNNSVTADDITLINQPYSIAFNGDALINDEVIFTNTGTVTFGDSGNTDLLQFLGGVTHDVGDNFLGGQIVTNNQDINSKLNKYFN